MEDRYGKFMMLINNINRCIKRIENENDAKVEGDDVLITCYRSYAHPQEGVLIFKISYKDKL